MFSFQRLTLPVVGLVLALSVVASLTPSIGRAQPTQQPATPDQADLAAVVAQVASAGSHMITAGYHVLDESIQGGEIPAGALLRVRWARIIIAATQWPEPLQASAQQMVEHSLRVEEALGTGDPVAAGTEAHELHEVADAFITDVYNWLASTIGGRGQQ